MDLCCDRLGHQVHLQSTITNSTYFQHARDLVEKDNEINVVIACYRLSRGLARLMFPTHISYHNIQAQN